MWKKKNNYTFRDIHHSVISIAEELDVTQVYTGGMVWQIMIKIFH